MKPQSEQGLDADVYRLAVLESQVSTGEFPVVGIGASAGGIEAFHGFFDHMAADSGMAFVVILHLPADRKSMLKEILMRWTSMPVIEVSERIQLRPEHVYVPPPTRLSRSATDISVLMCLRKASSGCSGRSMDFLAR